MTGPTPERPSPPCRACESPPTRGWGLRDDDKFCPLCGRQLLTLRPVRPAPDGSAWIYCQEGRPPTIGLIWRRREGAQGRPTRLGLDPGHPRSQALFRDLAVGDLAFDLREVRGAGPRGAVLVELRRRGGEPGPLELPGPGVEGGRLSIVGDAGPEAIPARLVPWADPPLAFDCAEEGVDARGGVLQIYRPDRTVALAMDLHARTPVFVLGVSPNRADGPGGTATLEGFEGPVRVAPGTPYRFRLVVRDADWRPGEAVRFDFGWELAGVDSGDHAFRGRVELSAGRRLEFKGPVLERGLQLGQVHHAFVLLSSTGGAGDEPPLAVESCAPITDPGEGDWLRVEAPRDRLEVGAGADPAEPASIRLKIDLTRMDRERFDGAELRGCLELRDDRARPWRHEFRVPVRRPPMLDDYLALDWGTTHTCAAQGDRRALRVETHPVRFDGGADGSLERFPSDVFFKDIQDPADPEILVGTDARLAGKGSPACFLRSVKRKFGRETVFVMDEAGRTRTYDVADVVLLLLRKLVRQAEEQHGWEVRRLGLTFPTKWTHAARAKLGEVARRLGERLGEERSVRFEVAPLRVDEANAVAIDLLNSGAPPDAAVFHVIPYDFGGGTIDTSVLRVERQGRGFRTRYLGIGGRADFGGDEVTRAVVMLLHGRLVDAIGRHRLGTGPGPWPEFKDIPLVPDGEPPADSRPETLEGYILGRKNWDVLWEIAENIKIDLCRKDGGDDDAEDDESPIRHRLDNRKSEIQCRVTEPGGAVAALSLDRLLDQLVVPGAGEVVDLDDLYDKELPFTLDDVYEHPLEDIHKTDRGREFSVRGRLQETVDELAWQCASAGVKPDVIALAGGACRLPLARRLLEEAFPGVRIHFDPECAKRRVARGLACYLPYQKSFRGKDLACSVDVTHRALGLLEPSPTDVFAHAYREIVPVGAPIDDPATWHPFEFRWEDGPAVAGPAGDDDDRGEDGPRLEVFVQAWQPLGRSGRDDARDPLDDVKTLEFGLVDLAHPVDPGPGDEPCDPGPLPLEPGEAYRAEIRLRGEDRIEVRIRSGGRTFGHYPLVRTAIEAGRGLQG